MRFFNKSNGAKPTEDDNSFTAFLKQALTDGWVVTLTSMMVVVAFLGMLWRR